jgi:serine/threonine protein kinase
MVTELVELLTTPLAGGMSDVFRALHHAWGFELALKRPKAPYYAREEDRIRFRDEVERWVGLGTHPNVCCCFGIEDVHGIPCVLSEWVGGGSLARVRPRRLYEGGTLAGLERMLLLALQAARALAYAHRKGVVHGDVKPGNFLLDEAGDALKVSDFGIASVRAPVELSLSFGDLCSERDPWLVSRITWRGATPAYASPEQERGERLGPETDCFSLAVSILELFNGGVDWGDVRHSWESGSEALYHLERLRHGPPHPGIPGLPARLADLLERSLAAEPYARPSLVEVADELEQILTELEQILTELGRPPRSLERPAESREVADGLNNRALFQARLGRAARAETLFAEALVVDPRHLEAQHNARVLAWLQGKIDDVALVRRLRPAARRKEDPWRAKRMLALVQIERGELEEAIRLLEEASAEAGDRPEVSTALALARSPAQRAAYRLGLFEEPEDGIWDAGFSSGGESVVVLSGAFDGTLRVRDLETGACRHVLEPRGGQVETAALSIGAQRALAGYGDGSVAVWDLETERRLHVLEPHGLYVTEVAFSRDARFATSSTIADPLIRIWNLEEGRCVRTLESGFTVAALSADGRRVLCGGDGYVALRDVETGRNLRILEGHRDNVWALALSLDGKTAASAGIASTGVAGTLRLWDVEAERCLRVLHMEIGNVAFSSDARTALTSPEDGRLRLWQLESGRCVRTFEGHADEDLGGIDLHLSADSRLALSHSSGEQGRVGGGRTPIRGTVRLWQLPRAALADALLQAARSRLAELE